MGRRKIEIKAIKDDRNRSVTFLKRKGGLFKKAYELSVLCQVDVAVIIFGHNKKLYEFSSGDINEAIGRYQYYGGAHEHKGPEDYMDKKDAGSEDEDDDVEAVARESGSPPHGPSMAQHLHGQSQFNHVGSASPPMTNGAFIHRGPSPQPPHNISRPGSRAHIRQPSQQHLMPPQHTGHMQVSQPPPQQQQPTYAYMPNAPMYNPQAAAGMQQRQGPGQPMPPGFPPQFAQQPGQPHPQQHPGQTPQIQHPSIQQIYAQEQQRRSFPPQFAQQHPPPPQHAQDQRPTPQPQASPQPPPQNQFSSPPLPQPKPLPAAARAHSIFTPIDDSRSLLAQHWGNSRDDPPRSDPPIKIEDQRSQSIDVAIMHRGALNGIAAPPPPPHLNTHGMSMGHPQRGASTPVIPSIHPPQPPSRTNSLQTKARGPKLTVQIPNEDDEDEPGTSTLSPHTTAAANRTPIQNPGAVLPPPSPSASALLSAGASGPPNPFARPPPPNGPNGFNGSNNRNDIETPISALPSRFVSDQLLPSPGGFYADWFNGRDNNMLPSPLAFPTPVAAKATSFGEEDERKRKLEESSNAPDKRVKT